MKRTNDFFKTLELMILVVITVLALVFVFTDDDLFQTIGSDAAVRKLAILLWATLGLSFLFMLLDFRFSAIMHKEYRELDYTLRNDRTTGLANRYGVDTLIEKYVDKPLPPQIGCIMLEISNIREINDKHGHLLGNSTIQSFANMLMVSSVGICFVGRNGGCKFLALFEDCNEEKLNTFLTRIDKKINEHNSAEDSIHLEYRSGRAYNKEENLGSITALIALADRRLAAKNDSVTGFANRAGCDDIISLYADKPLPSGIGCVMLGISNIREINDTYGHLEGNAAIRRFGDVLRKAAGGNCFVGRNGGVEFMALFENCKEESIQSFLAAVDQSARETSADPSAPTLEYRFGIAFNEDPEINTVNRLVALADRRLKEVL